MTREKPIIRMQRLFVIHRNGRFAQKVSGGFGWIDDIRSASVYPEKQAQTIEKIDIGMPCDLIEIIPQRRYPDAR